MAALGWLLNLGFAGGGAAVATPNGATNMLLIMAKPKWRRRRQGGMLKLFPSLPLPSVKPLGRLSEG